LIYLFLDQYHGIFQINSAVAQMETVTQNNAASAEQSTASAQELFAQAEILNKAVHELVILIGGRKSA
jgi:methyl-accepting chemotaxis protein